MSKSKRLRQHLNQVAICRSNQKIAKDETLVKIYVQATNKDIKPETVHRLIQLAQGQVAEVIPFKDGDTRCQYRVSIKEQFLDALGNGWPITIMSRAPFKKPANYRPLTTREKLGLKPTAPARSQP